jgi:ATP-binding cassette subfamily C protein
MRRPEAAVRMRDPYRNALRGLRGIAVVVGLLSAAINILMLTGSIYMLQVYDRVLGSGSIPTLFGLFGIVVVLYAFLGLYEFLRARLLSRAALRLDMALGPPAFGAWLAAGVADGSRHAGDRTTQPLRDIDILRGFLSGGAVHGLLDLPWIPLYLFILFAIHPWLGWLTVGGAGVVAVAALLNRVLTQGSLARAMALDSASQSFADQAQRNAEVVRALGMQGRIGQVWRGLHTAGLGAGQRGSDISEMISAFSRSFRLLLQSAMLTLGALLVLQQEITGGMIIASSIIAGRALAPVDQIIGQSRLIGRAAIAHRQLTAFFADWKPDPPRIQLPPPTGQIVVSRLTKFLPGSAPGADRPRILNQVSFALEPGDGLGVIGNSAAGKSTLARLIAGAWTPDAGEIRLDGATPDQWDPAELGRSVGYLPQALEMLPGTIRDNIARFDPDASDDAVIDAARQAGVHDMILRLPQGYATRLGGAEQPLSGGQIQRLGLARAIFGNPRIVVLDEPNSNLDVAGDEALAHTILGLRRRGAVVFVMAHRPSAIAAVNKVLILHSGIVAQFGNKDEIMQAALRSGDHGGAHAPAPPAAAPGRQAAPAEQEI